MQLAGSIYVGNRATTLPTLANLESEDLLETRQLKHRLKMDAIERSIVNREYYSTLEITPRNLLQHRGSPGIETFLEV